MALVSTMVVGGEGGGGSHGVEHFLLPLEVGHQM
jgi:hypothetical protein